MVREVDNSFRYCGREFNLHMHEMIYLRQNELEKLSSWKVVV